MQFQTKRGLVDIPNEEVLKAARELGANVSPPSESRGASQRVVSGALLGALQCKERLEWLHRGGGRDPEGYEWGVFRVKWNAQGQPESVLHTLSDFSDLDAEMMREAGVANYGDLTPDHRPPFDADEIRYVIPPDNPLGVMSSPNT